MRRGFRRGLAFGVAYGLMAALFAEAVRPRSGSTVLLDWDEVARLAMSRLPDQRMSPERLAEAAATYNRFAAGVRAPLLETVGGPPERLSLPDFEALDRAGWLELNIGILRRVMEPLAAVTQVPESWLAITGRAGLSRYVSLMLEFLSRRVLGQFDPQLMGKEPIRAALYLVEPNVVTWQAEAKLNGADLRRWLILHEMTHAWQFAAHPWLRDHVDRQVEELIELASRGSSARGLDRLRALTIGVPSQWDLVRRMQATMSVIEGHGNLVMNLVGRRLLRSFDRLDAAYRKRSGERGVLEQVLWRVTGLEMKMEQYRAGERFARAIHDRYGMEALNRVWEGPESLPRPEEIDDPAGWYRRVVRTR